MLKNILVLRVQSGVDHTTGFGLHYNHWFMGGPFLFSVFLCYLNSSTPVLLLLCSSGPPQHNWCLCRNLWPCKICCHILWMGVFHPNTCLPKWEPWRSLHRPPSLPDFQTCLPQMLLSLCNRMKCTHRKTRVWACLPARAGVSADCVITGRVKPCSSEEAFASQWRDISLLCNGIMEARRDNTRSKPWEQQHHWTLGPQSISPDNWQPRFCLWLRI